jgi:hypothetical protein
MPLKRGPKKLPVGIPSCQSKVVEEGEKRRRRERKIASVRKARCIK